MPSDQQDPTPTTGGASALAVQVVAPDGTLWSGDATLVTVPSASGSLGIMVRREPVAAVLLPGTVRLRPVAGGVVEIDITGGFVVADDDEVTVLVDSVVPRPAAG